MVVEEEAEEVSELTWEFENVDLLLIEGSGEWIWMQLEG